MEYFRRGIAKLREWQRFREDPAAAAIVKDYRSKGGIFLGAEGEPYRLKITVDSMELIRVDPEQPIIDLDAERERVMQWGAGYEDVAAYAQRYLRVALGLPADVPSQTQTPESK